MNEETSNSEAAPISQPAETATSETKSSARPTVTFQGNNYDLMSVVGITIGGVVLLSCATCNFGFYCLPFVPIGLGVIGLAMAKESVDPDRTRLLSWLSVGSGAVILALLVAGIALYIFFIIFAIAAENGGF
jgi:hypothetical protein